jgi:hypothetical protein
MGLSKEREGIMARGRGIIGKPRSRINNTGVRNDIKERGKITVELKRKCLFHFANMRTVGAVSCFYEILRFAKHHPKNSAQLLLFFRKKV